MSGERKVTQVLQNQRIVIIGGSSGIGLAVAQAAGAAGAQLVIASRSAQKLAAARAQIAGDVEGLTLDVTDPAAVHAFFAALGPFDHLVVSAGEVRDVIGPALSLDHDHARAHVESRFWGPFLAARYGAPLLRPGGSIVLFSGVIGERPEPGLALAGAVNAAVEVLGRTLALELAPAVRVNVVSPGLVDSPLLAWLPEAARAEMFAATAATMPARRPGTPAEVAQGVLYLLGNAFATGTTLHVDGGYRYRAG